MTQRIPLAGVYNGNTLLTIGEYLTGDTINVAYLGTGTANSSNYLRGDGFWGTISTALKSGIVAFDSRDTLRTISASNDDIIFVESLGIFKFYSGSTEPDDDETAFTNTGSNGVWLLEVPHWDFIDSTLLLPEEDQNERLDDLETIKTTISYDSRNSLRSMVPNDGQLILVESLGLFKFYLGSTEKDDDQYCFATTNGRWMLECPHWDVIFSELYIPLKQLSEQTFVVQFTNSITSVGALAVGTQVVYVPQAVVGDSVVVNPGKSLVGNVSIYGYVSSVGQVTVAIGNPSASTATLTSDTWTVTVIKQQ